MTRTREISSFPEEENQYDDEYEEELNEAVSQQMNIAQQSYNNPAQQPYNNSVPFRMVNSVVPSNCGIRRVDIFASPVLEVNVNSRISK